MEDRIELPDGFQPEGIAIGAGPTAYVGSLADGDVYVVDLRTGTEITTLEGPGTPSVGLKVDQRGRLFIAGGPTGEARVVDAETGDVLATYQLTTGPAFINDVVLTRDGAWFTNSSAAELYFLPVGPSGELPDDSEVVTRRSRATGCSSRVQRQRHRRDARPPGAARHPVGDRHPVSGGPRDGRGDRGRPRRRRTAQRRRPPRGRHHALRGAELLERRRGRASRRRWHERHARRPADEPGFDVPTTVARFGHSLFLPNARFSTPPTPDTEYDVVRIDR